MCTNVCLCLKMVLCLNVFVFADTLHFSATHYIFRLHIMFFGHTLQKIHLRVTLTQKGLSCDEHSARCLAEKQAHHHFILLHTDTYNFLSESNLSIFVLLQLNDLIVCLFSVRHL